MNLKSLNASMKGINMDAAVMITTVVFGFLGLNIHLWSSSKKTLQKASLKYSYAVKISRRGKNHAKVFATCFSCVLLATAMMSSLDWTSYVDTTYAIAYTVAAVAVIFLGRAMVDEVDEAFSRNKYQYQ